MIGTMVCALAMSLSVGQQSILFEPPPKTFVAPGRLFSVKIPKKWQIILTKSPYEYQFAPSNHNDARMYVRRIVVPVGASPMQLALRAIEGPLAKLPRFKLLKRKRVSVGGIPAVSVLGTYAFQGNIQYPRAVEQVYLVSENEAFVLHFDSFLGAAAGYAKDLEGFYQTFIPRPTNSAGLFSEESDDEFPETEFPEIEKAPF